MSDLVGRRDVIKSVVIAGGVALVASELAAETKSQPCAPVALDKGAVSDLPHIGPKNISVNVSADKLAETILFDNLSSTSDSNGSKTPHVSINSAFIRVPVAAGSDPECQLLGYTLDIRGHISLTAGARASIAVVVNGDTFQADFPFGNEGSRDFKQRFFVVARTADSTLKTVVSPCLDILIVATTETAQSKDKAVIQVDSLDVEARRA